MRPLLTVALLAGCGRAETAQPTGLVDSLAAISQRFDTTHHLPGLAVGVWRQGQTVYRAGFGTTALPGGHPVTAETIFHVASVTPGDRDDGPAGVDPYGRQAGCNRLPLGIAGEFLTRLSLRPSRRSGAPRPCRSPP